MATSPTVLCPVDYSDCSRGALRYAAAVAAHFRATLTVLSVEDPLLTEARDLGLGILPAAEDSCCELIEFVDRTLACVDRAGLTIAYDVRVGKPAREILGVARERCCDLIVMSTHGLTGVPKTFFGSTTERVLRSTPVPVLVTPAVDAGPRRLEDITGRVRRILVPVDLDSQAQRQLEVAEAIALALGVPALILHVVPPIRALFRGSAQSDAVATMAHARAGDKLARLVGSAQGLRIETLVAAGEPAKEIVNVARERDAGLIVIGLHGSSSGGPRMGAVTYRVLCQTASMVLAIPPVVAPNEKPGRRETAAADRSGRAGNPAPAQVERHAATAVAANSGWHRGCGAGSSWSTRPSARPGSRAPGPCAVFPPVPWSWDRIPACGPSSISSA